MRYRGWSPGSFAGRLAIGVVAVFVLWIFTCLFLSL